MLQQLLDYRDGHAGLATGVDHCHLLDFRRAIDPHGTDAGGRQQALFLVEMQGTVRHAERVRHVRDGEAAFRQVFRQRCDGQEADGFARAGPTVGFLRLIGHHESSPRKEE